MRLVKVILCGLLLSACKASGPVQADSTQPTPWSTDVIGISEAQLSVNYWVDKIENASRILQDQKEIEDFNKEIFSTDQNMVDLALFPDQLPGVDVKDRIRVISKPNSSDLYSPAGEILGSEGYRKYTENLGLEDIPDSVEVQFALIVRRTSMRAYPTDDRYYKSPEDQNLDRFQENGLFPGDALAVLHVSTDHVWSFVQSYNYAAWVRSENIAIGDRQIIQQYQDANRFLVITGDKIRTSFNPEIPTLSELQLEMGIRIPLADRETYSNSLYGQNPYASNTVLLPMRNQQGQLEIKPALVSRSKDVSEGFIPFTRENIVRQAFKFLGERYGWGHSYNARDCTGFIMEVYKTFGLQMPRNTGQQGSGSYGQNTWFTAQSSREEKLQALKRMDIGDLIYVPGHVLMYIGDISGEPYVIHDVSKFGYMDENGGYYEGILNGVSVTPFIPLYGSRKSPYIDLMYNIKRIR
ncbi:MAG: SH3 domain-containing protein [Xanthomonadales bacterium]|nr:SH3 domain-containing protein [Xanthomonadales bacterium]